MLNDWTGGCSDQIRGEYLLPAQGGHNGYYGNEIYAIALRADKNGRIWLLGTGANPAKCPWTTSRMPTAKTR